MRRRIYKEVKPSPKKREEIIEEIPQRTTSSKEAKDLKANLDAIDGKIDLILEENSKTFTK